MLTIIVSDRHQDEVGERLVELTLREVVVCGEGPEVGGHSMHIHAYAGSANESCGIYPLQQPRHQRATARSVRHRGRNRAPLCGDRFGQIEATDGELARCFFPQGSMVI